VRYPRQEHACPSCEGYKRVAIIVKGPPLFDEVLRRPLPMTFAKARQQIMNYRGDDAGALTMVVRRLAAHLETTPCPWCSATGIAYAIQQLTPEEAAEVRAAEEDVS
jgi:hypothetical protein